jgi:hypothetical protein
MPSDITYNSFSSEKQASILNNFMSLFAGNTRGYGIGEFQDARQRDEDMKWTPGHVRWVWGNPGSEQLHAHLTGEVLTGIGVLCDDGKCRFACLDIDEYEDIDYREVMQKIKATGLPLVAFRTKSGGLRIVIFFSEPIEATDVIPRMRKLSAILGYAGCEVFPKQTSLRVENDDCPSWIYLPYGGTGGIFPEQSALNEMGNLMEIDEAITYCLKRRVSRVEFINLFAAEKAADANGKANGKKHPNGVWVQEETATDTIDAIFWDGPVCLRILARMGVGQGQRNNFLAHCATFLKKKYENWDKALDWVNINVLIPVGDLENLSSIKKRWSTHQYEYQCHDQPMATYCDAHGCRSKKYGVGASNGVGYPELGMTIINRRPAIYIVSIGSTRLVMSAQELLNPNTFQVKFLEEQMPIPHLGKKEVHINWINASIQAATKVEPKHMMRSDASELETLAEWFGRQVPIWVKKGQPNDKTDVVRVKEDEQRLYLKWDKLSTWMRRSFKDTDVKAMRAFLNDKGEDHQGGGHWWRYTMSLPFSLFDEEQIKEWLNPE